MGPGKPVKFVLAEISIRSPRKLFIFTIYNNNFNMKVSKNMFNLILKKNKLTVGDPFAAAPKNKQ